MKDKDRIIFALDVPELDRKTHFLLHRLEGKIKTIKVGLELFTRHGLSLLDQLHGFDIFLDLKLDDVPTTITRTVRNLQHPSIKFMTLMGETDTLKAAYEGWDGPTYLYVPMLSSRVFSFNPSMEDYYLKDMVKAAVLFDKGIGFIASGDRIKIVREFAPDSVIVSPGVRLPSKEADEHKKVATPHEAINNGADYIVIGRPIRDAKSQIQAISGILKNIKNG